MGADAWQQAGWGSLEVVTALAAGVLLAAAFVAWERRAREPMLPMRFFRSRAFGRATRPGFFFFASLYGALFFLAQFLQTALAMGRSAPGCGCSPGPPCCSWSLRSPAPSSTGSASGRCIVGGLLLQAVGMAWIGLIAAPDLAYAKLVAPLIVAGAGVSMAMPASQNAVLNAVAKSEIGKASGTFNMLRFLGGVFGIAITVAAFAGTGSVASPEAFSAGFARAIGVAAALSLSGAVAGLWLPSVADLTFLPVLLRVLRRNVKSKATLES